MLMSRVFSLAYAYACAYAYALVRTSLKQPRRRRHQERHKFAYLTMKNNSLARFARAVLIFKHFADVLVLSTT